MEKASLSVSFVKANLKAISQHGLDEAQAHERPMNVKGGQNLFYLESRANKGTKKLDSECNGNRKRPKRKEKPRGYLQKLVCQLLSTFLNRSANSLNKKRERLKKQSLSSLLKSKKAMLMLNPVKALILSDTEVEAEMISEEVVDIILHLKDITLMKTDSQLPQADSQAQHFHILQVSPQTLLIPTELKKLP